MKGIRKRKKLVHIIVVIIISIFFFLGMVLLKIFYGYGIIFPKNISFHNNTPAISLEVKLPKGLKLNQPSISWPEGLLELDNFNKNARLIIRTEPLCRISVPLYLEFRLHRISSDWAVGASSQTSEDELSGTGIVEGLLNNVPQKGLIFLRKKDEWCIEVTILLTASEVDSELGESLINLSKAITF